jgi:hypothetical protein
MKQTMIDGDLANCMEIENLHPNVSLSAFDFCSNDSLSNCVAYRHNASPFSRRKSCVDTRDLALNELKNTRAQIFSSVCLLQSFFKNWTIYLQGLEDDAYPKKGKFEVHHKVLSRSMKTWTRYVLRRQTKESVFICMNAMFCSKMKRRFISVWNKTIKSSEAEDIETLGTPSYQVCTDDRNSHSTSVNEPSSSEWLSYLMASASIVESKIVDELKQLELRQSSIEPQTKAQPTNQNEKFLDVWKQDQAIPTYVKHVGSETSNPSLRPDHHTKAGNPEPAWRHLPSARADSHASEQGGTYTRTHQRGLRPRPANRPPREREPRLSLEAFSNTFLNAQSAARKSQPCISDRPYGRPAVPRMEGLLLAPAEDLRPPFASAPCQAAHHPEPPSALARPTDPSAAAGYDGSGGGAPHPGSSLPHGSQSLRDGGSADLSDGAGGAALSTPKPRARRPRPLSPPRGHGSDALPTPEPPAAARPPTPAAADWYAVESALPPARPHPPAAARARRQVRFAPSCEPRDPDAPAASHPPPRSGQRAEPGPRAARAAAYSPEATARLPRPAGGAAAAGGARDPEPLPSARRGRGVPGAAATARRGLAGSADRDCAGGGGWRDCAGGGGTSGDEEDLLLRGLPWLKVSLTPYDPLDSLVEDRSERNIPGSSACFLISSAQSRGFGGGGRLSETRTA